VRGVCPIERLVEQVYARAQELCQQVGESPQLFPVLWGLWRFYTARCEYPRAQALGEWLLSLAQQVHDAALLLQAHHALWATLVWSGKFAAAQFHLEQGRALYAPSSTALTPCSTVVMTLACVASPMGPGPCGSSAIRTRLYGACTRHSPWPTPWRTSPVWPMPCALTQRCINSAESHKPRRSGQQR